MRYIHTLKGHLTIKRNGGPTRAPTWRNLETLVLRGRGQMQRARVRIQRIHGCERPHPSLCSLLHTPVPPHWQPVTSEPLAPPAGGTVNHDSLRHSALVFQLRHECLCVSEELLPPPALATPSALFSEHSVRGTRNKWNRTGRAVAQGSV